MNPRIGIVGIWFPPPGDPSNPKSREPESDGKARMKWARRLWAILFSVLVGCSSPVGGAAIDPGQPPPTTVPVAATEEPAADVPPAGVELEAGLPQVGVYGFIDVTIAEAVLASVEPRTFLRDWVASPDLHLFLTLSLTNTSETDVANWPPNPFGLEVDGVKLETPEVLEGRPHIGLTQLNTTEMVLAFKVPAGTSFEQSVLTLAESGRIPLVLPLVGEVTELPYPVPVGISGSGPARGRGAGCNQELEVTILEATTGIDLQSEEYPSQYGSRRAEVGDRFLTVGIRVFNHGGSLCGAGGTNFGNDDVRLFVDGIPRAPITWVNTSIDLEAAKDLYFDFVYPADTSNLEISVGAEETALTANVELPELPRAPGE
ncbi:MAG: hypothetical protein ACFCU2_10705 [Acidimicrobiia bacterium]